MGQLTFNKGYLLQSSSHLNEDIESDKYPNPKNFGFWVFLLREFFINKKPGHTNEPYQEYRYNRAIYELDHFLCSSSLNLIHDCFYNEHSKQSTNNPPSYLLMSLSTLLHDLRGHTLNSNLDELNDQYIVRELQTCRALQYAHTWWHKMYEEWTACAWR